MDVKTGVVFVDLRTLAGSKPVNWMARRYQIFEENDAGIMTMRVLGWRIPAAKRLTSELWVNQTQRLIKSYVRRHGVPDLIHAHCVHQAGIAAMEAKGNWRIPYVVTEHFSGYARGLMSDLMLSQARDVFFQADRVVAVSHKLASDIRTYSRGKDIQVIPNVVDTDFFVPPAEPRSSKPFRFLFVGFLTENKRVEDLLDAFARQFGANGAAKLVIAGDGVHRPVLESKVAELGIESAVEFLGMLSREQVRNAMHEANAFVTASPVETFGVVLVEAMSTGLPVIAVRSGGPEEFVTEKVGRLVPPDDAGSLQRAMADVVGDYARWRDAAPEIRSYVVSAFGEAAVGSRLIETYNAVMQQ
jgi:glycosyltransferase involved in cell wall biosynthesis